MPWVPGLACCATRKEQECLNLDSTRHGPRLASHSSCARAHVIMDIVYERSARQRDLIDRVRNMLVDSVSLDAPPESPATPNSKPESSEKVVAMESADPADADVWAKLERELYEAQEPRVLPDTDAWRAHQDALAHAWEGRWMEACAAFEQFIETHPIGTGIQGPDFHVDLARAEYNIGVLYAHVGRFALGRAGAAGHFRDAQAILNAALKEAQGDAGDAHPMLAAAEAAERRAVVENHKRWADNTELAMTTGMDAQAHEQAGRYGEAAEAWDACADLWAKACVEVAGEEDPFRDKPDEKKFHDDARVSADKARARMAPATPQ